MMRIRFTQVATICSLVVLSGTVLLAREDHAARLLILQSFSPDSTAPTPFEEMVRPALEKKLGSPIDAYTEYLELKRFAGEEHSRTLARQLQTRYRNVKIDLIVPVGFPALEFIRQHGGEISPDTPVVFVSVQSTQIQGIDFPANITGVVHEDGWEAALGEIFRLHPDTQEVVVVAGSASIDHQYVEQQKLLFKPYTSRVKFRYLTDLPLVDMLAIVSKLPAKTIVIQSAFSWDSRGQTLTDEGALKLVYKAANAPVYALAGGNLGQGFVGGPVPAYRERYSLVADLAYRVLRGEQPAAIPIQHAIPEHAMAFDWRQLRRWGLSEDRLPAGSLIAFREPPPWMQFRWVIVAAAGFLVLETALIVGLLTQRIRRRRVEMALLKRGNEIRDLAARLITAQEDERQRIARELHDDICQRIATAAISLSVLRQRIRPAEADLLAQTARQQLHLNELLEGVRQLSHTLHPPLLKISGIQRALEQHCEEFRGSRGIEVETLMRGEFHNLSPEVALCLYRVAQESLANIAKHSGATTVRVSLSQEDADCLLTVSDNGHGFGVNGEAEKGGLGLLSMQERVRLAGGELSIASRPGGGTTITARIPCPIRPSPVPGEFAALPR